MGRVFVAVAIAITAWLATFLIAANRLHAHQQANNTHFGGNLVGGLLFFVVLPAYILVALLVSRAISRKHLATSSAAQAEGSQLQRVPPQAP